MSTTLPVMPSQPQEGACVCYACGQAVHPNPLTSARGVSRGYEVTWVALDETDTPYAVRFLKCADCLGPERVRGAERHEAMNRLAREARVCRTTVPPPPHTTPLPLRHDDNT